MKTFFVKSKETTLITFATDGLKYTIVKEHDEHKNIFPLPLLHTCTSEILMYWLNSRISPLGKELFKKIVPDKRCQGPLGNLGLTLGLSLNDCYWVDDGSHTWKEVNLYENDLNPEIAQLAFNQGIQPENIIGSRSPEFGSYGNERKCWFKRDNRIFLMKSDEADADGVCHTTKEWFAAQIAEAMHIPHVFYNLRYRHDTSENPICECESFCDMHKSFVSASSFFAMHDIHPALVRLIGSTKGFHDRLSLIYGQEEYEDMMVFDAIIGNSDRHFLNFGKIRDNDTGEVRGSAPLFDNGISFDPEEQCCFFSRDKQLQYFLRPRHEEMLVAVKNLELQQHSIVKISEKARETMQKYIQDFSNFALKNIKTQCFVCQEHIHQYLEACRENPLALETVPQEEQTEEIVRAACEACQYCEGVDPQSLVSYIREDLLAVVDEYHGYWSQGMNGVLYWYDK